MNYPRILHSFLSSSEKSSMNYPSRLQSGKVRVQENSSMNLGHIKVKSPRKNKIEHEITLVRLHKRSSVPEKIGHELPKEFYIKLGFLKVSSATLLG